MNEEQCFAFDTWGFLVVEDAITPAHVAALQAGADDKGPSLHSQLGCDGGFWSQEAYSGEASFFCPSDADGWDGADDRKRAILTPPTSQYVERKAALAEAAAR